MKQRLRRVLSILCILALITGCLVLPALATEPAQKITRIIVVEWNDENDYDGLRPGSVSVTIGSEPAVTVSKDNGWIAETEAPQGAELTAGSAVSGYSASVQGATTDVTTVKYTHIVEKTSQTATVEWKDKSNTLRLRPESVMVHLTADGDLYKALTASETNSWKVSFEDLPKYRKNSGGKTPIIYAVEVGNVPESYTTSVSGSTVTCSIKTGTLTLNVETAGVPEGADISGLELKIDGPDPDIPKTLFITGGSYDFGAVLPGAYLVTNKNADTLIEGYVMDPSKSQAEDAVYVKPGESGTLKFRYTWKEAEGTEPNENPLENAGTLTFDILGPDPRMPVTGITYAQFTNGQYKLEDLVPGVYVVVERNAETLVQAFTLSTSDSTTGVCINVTKEGATASLFNKYNPLPTPEPDAELIDVPVVKIWNDDNNKDGNRPEKITVHLYANGTEEDSAVLSAANGWAYVFTDKLRYDENDDEIKYTVSEDAVEWYTPVIRGTYITNDYTPEVTSAAVYKIWNDDNNKLNLRPTSIAVTLKPVNEVYVLNEANGWSAVVENLPTKINGQPVTYSWTEQETIGYKLDSVTKTGIATVFTNRIVRVPEVPPDKKQPDTPQKDEWAVFEDYDTALGIPLLINHVGDCFD